MFLNEVALGKECRITCDDGSLTKAPDGYNSVLACGRTEPGGSEGRKKGQEWLAAHWHMVNLFSSLSLAFLHPDPAYDKEIIMDGKKVLVAQGNAIPMSEYQNSSFAQSEYLIYQESQCRIRYLVQLLFWDVYLALQPHPYAEEALLFLTLKRAACMTFGVPWLSQQCLLFTSSPATVNWGILGSQLSWKMRNCSLACFTYYAAVRKADTLHFAILYNGLCCLSQGEWCGSQNCTTYW